ncbi:MAG: GNAT family N-acetyltransferase [Candidatus Magnetoovum sp. WYHC-5]|nr:GNAT family N-acetyltransferase [Candidatus Magnetoovum sp. WYHC-5]
MVNDHIDIRQYKKGDEEKINNLFCKVFKEERSIDEWKWKFVENPAVKEPGDWISLAVRNGEIIGHYASVAVELQIGEKVVKVPSPVDSMIAPDSKVSVSVFKNLFKHNVEITKKYSYFGFGFPNEKAYMVGKRMLGYKDIATMIPFFRRLSIKTMIKRRFKSIPQIVLQLIHKISQLFFLVQINIYSTKATIKLIDSFDNRVDNLWAKIKHNYGIWAVRKEEYLNWRYKNPQNQIIVCEKNKTLTGFAVCKIVNTDDATAGYINDLVYSENPSALIAGVLKYMLKHDVDYVLFALMKDDPMITVIKEAKFIEHEAFKPFPVVFFPFYQDIQEESYLQDHKNWHLTYGDLDRY